MIKYQLRCALRHEFDGWFRDSGDFDEQSADGLLACPVCGSGEVEKAIMAPSVATGPSADRREEMRRTMAEAAARAREYVGKHFDYVGDRFPEEARKIHYGEKKAQGIYGEASAKEVSDLVEEGVPVAPLPRALTPDHAGRPIGSRKALKKPLN
jgi:hypothetical protein